MTLQFQFAKNDARYPALVCPAYRGLKPGALVDQILSAALTKGSGVL
jgi:hypothetical protein